MHAYASSTEPRPLSFNFDSTTFRVGDLVSYRIPEHFEDFPFVGTLAEVQDDYVLIATDDATCPDLLLTATREDRPVVEHFQLAHIASARSGTY